MVQRLPEQDRYSHARNYLEDSLAIAMGGRLAEEIVYGPECVTTGAANDIKQATDLARRMVTEWGMSRGLGPLRYSDNEEEVFLGHSVTQRKNVSEATARLIDDEIRGLIDHAETRARDILTEHIDGLHTVARALLEYETLTGDEIAGVLRGESIVRASEEAPQRAEGARSAVPSTDDGEEAPGELNPEPQPGS